MRILVIHGPNLNMLSKRDTTVYGKQTLDDVNSAIQLRAAKLNVETSFFQANSEGDIVDFLQQESPQAQAIIINPGALTHYGLSLRDALEDTRLPIVEVHISNIYAREEFRAHSVVAPIARGQISGLGAKGYLVALEYLAAELNK